MRAFAQKSGPQLLVAIGLVLVGFVFGFLVARGPAAPPLPELPVQPTLAVAPPSIAPSARSTPASPGTPPPEPTAGRPSSTGALSASPDAAAVVAIWDSVERLREKRAYRFTVGLAGRSPSRLDEPSNSSIGVRGSLVQQPALAIDSVFASQMIEFGGDAGISSSQRFVLVGDTVWAPRPGQSPDPQPASGNFDELMLFLPDGMATRLIIPFAAGFESVGVERRGTLDTVHYRLTDGGAHVYATATRCDGPWTGDLWIAADGGQLVAAELECAVPAASGTNFQVQVEVTDIDDPTIKIEPPS
jgi:hypothetical protein